jgi:hypothetical protein
LRAGIAETGPEGVAEYTAQYRVPFKIKYGYFVSQLEVGGVGDLTWRPTMDTPKQLVKKVS